MAKNWTQLLQAWWASDLYKAGEAVLRGKESSAKGEKPAKETGKAG